MTFRALRPILCGLICVGSLSQVAMASEGGAALFDMTLEELMHVEVVSSTRSPVELRDLPAAVHVLSREDIRRSGATSIPEALRMVPGLNVARVNSHKWAVSARGFQTYLSEKMLVMIDGRTIYMEYASLVAWQLQGVRLEEIERIEVILGPGGSVWGANAVNGIINVLTRHASETQGGELVLLGGNEAAEGSLRYGFSGEAWAARAFLKYGWEDACVDPVAFASTCLKSGDALDSWRSLRGGVRIDSSHDAGGATDAGSLALLQ
jgi:iron complex outermembrane receptor protein